MKKYILSAIAVLSGLLAMAQNFDPTVTVTRQYEGKTIDVEKAEVSMSVPDSLTRFDLQFDYSVFDNPYRGAYEFNAYSVDMRPAPDAYREKQFYLKAGAGYSLHPIFDVIWSPLLKGNFRLSLYGEHRSYFGNYRKIAPSAERVGESGYEFGAVKGEKWSGYEMISRAGVNGRSDWKKNSLLFDVAYQGIHSRDWSAGTVQRGYNAADAKLRFFAHDTGERQFLYDVSLKYRFAGEMGKDLLFTASKYDGFNSYHDASADISLGMRLNSFNSFMADLTADMSSCATGDLYGAVLGFSPHYVYGNDRFYARLGIKLQSPAWNAIIPEDTENRNYGQLIYPDIRLNFELVRRSLNLYLNATGGVENNRYQDIIARNRHFTLGYAWSFDGSSPVNYLYPDMQRFNANLGFKGNIADRFTYDVCAGYAMWQNRMYYGVYMDYLNEKDGNFGDYHSQLAYGPANRFYVNADLGWKSRDVEANAYFSYKDERSDAICFLPSVFSAGFDVTYNLKRRLFLGLSVDFASNRKGNFGTMVLDGKTDGDETIAVPAFIPWYIDLGLHAEYLFNRKLSVWLEGSNLANMTIQRVPLYAEQGISFTAGLTFNF